jgi:hypothetical protein
MGELSMTSRLWLVLSLASLVFVSSPRSSIAPACCPAPPSGKAVVNADQTVIMIWDAASKTQHFIRQASFKSDADDFGFLVPTPTQPDLQESGNDAFPFLRKLTEPEKRRVPRPPSGGFGCSEEKTTRYETKDAVRVLDEKMVAGFQATVLEAKSADALVDWLKQHGYAFSPEVQAWAKPYVEAGWKITALKMAKDKKSRGENVDASALRLTFKTDRPLFPYREPDPKAAAKTLAARQRLLRIYFVAETRYKGELAKNSPWSGKAVWANTLNDEARKKLLALLGLPTTSIPERCWLTEFEDNWSYTAAPADVTFQPDFLQHPIAREPIIEYVSSPWTTDPTVYAMVALVVVPPLVRRSRRRREAAAIA